MQDIDNLEARVAAAAQALTSRQDRQNELRGSISQLEAEIGTLRSANEQCAQKLEETQDKTRCLAAEHEELGGENKRLITENKRFRDEFERFEKDNEKLRQEHDKTRADHEELGGENKRLIAENKRFRDEFERYETNNEELRLERDKFRAGRDSIVQERDQLNELLEALVAAVESENTVVTANFEQETRAADVVDMSAAVADGTTGQIINNAAVDPNTTAVVSAMRNKYYAEEIQDIPNENAKKLMDRIKERIEAQRA